MSVEKNKEVTRLTLEEVMNKSNLELIPKLFAPDYVHRAASGQEIRGHEGWKQTVIDAHAAFPDIHYAVDELIGDGDKVVCRFTGTGTFKGEYMGAAPNGKQFTSKAMFVNRFENGKVAETWAVSNPMIAFQQLGINPPGFVPSQEANKTAIRRTMEEIWSKGNLSLIPDLFTPDYAGHQAGGNEVKGQDAFRDMVARARAAIPDFRCEINGLVAEGDMVTCLYTMTGTNTGSMAGAAPTGRKLNAKASFVTRMKDGKSAETWAFSDYLTSARQMGSAPAGFVLSAEGNKAILKRDFDEVLNKGNVSLLDELMDENYVMRGASGQEVIKGREGSKAYFAQGRAAFSGLHATVDEMVGEGDKVVAAGVWEGTNTGPFQGVAATGKHVKYGYVAIYSFAGGKITGGRIVSDTTTLYQQLGITPPAVAPTR